MEEMTPCSVKDQETFRRVWQRVMAGRDEAQCPIETMQGDLSCQRLEELSRRQDGLLPDAPVQEEMPQPGWQRPQEPPQEEMPAPEPPAQQPPDQPDSLPEPDGPSCSGDLPPLWEQPSPAGDRTARLRHQVMEALEGWQFYRHLARRARGSDARVLNNLAGELHRQARKLSAAYFLLTGLRYWPSELLTTPAIASYWGALRQRHQAEQRQETAFRIAADDWDDPALLELYAELIDACQRRCRQLRALLEQSMA